MTSREIAQFVDSAIMFFAGFYGVLVGFRVIGKKPGVDPAYDAKHAKYLRHLKWLGPALMVIAIILYAFKRAGH
jgi:hypothetical protein